MSCKGSPRELPGSTAKRPGPQSIIPSILRQLSPATRLCPMRSQHHLPLVPPLPSKHNWGADKCLALVIPERGSLDEEAERRDPSYYGGTTLLVVCGPGSLLFPPPSFPALVLGPACVKPPEPASSQSTLTPTALAWWKVSLSFTREAAGCGG